MPKTKPTTLQEQHFATVLLSTQDPAIATKEAGFSTSKNKSYLKQRGNKIKARPRIQKAISTIVEQTLGPHDVTKERVLLELARLAFFDPREIVNDDGTLKNLHELSEDSAAAVSGIDINEHSSRSGDVSVTSKIKLSDKLGALKILSSYLGIDKQEITISGNAKHPIAMLIEQVSGTAIPIASDD